MKKNIKIIQNIILIKKMMSIVYSSSYFNLTSSINALAPSNGYIGIILNTNKNQLLSKIIWLILKMKHNITTIKLKIIPTKTNN